MGEGMYGSGGVFVPMNSTILGTPDKATGFFVDFERYTPFARGKDGVEDPDATLRYQDFFRLGLGVADANVAEVLRNMDGKATISAAAPSAVRFGKRAHGARPVAAPDLGAEHPSAKAKAGQGGRLMWDQPDADGGEWAGPPTAEPPVAQIWPKKPKSPRTPA